MADADELPLYVPEDGRARRAVSRSRHEKATVRSRPRVIVRVDYGAAAAHTEHAALTQHPGPALESQIGHLSNFAFLRQVWVPPDEAVAAFDRWRARTQVVRARRGRLAFGADLTSPRSPVPVLGAEPLRALSCRLRVAHWPHEVPVEMYLLPWNSLRTVVDLRPRGRRWPAIGVPAGAYFAAGHAVLDLVVAHLHAGSLPVTAQG